MQGNLNEIDIRSILQLIELQQGTGQLFVERCSSCCDLSYGRYSSKGYNLCQPQSWFIFLENGQIVYTANANENLSRLSEYLRHYQIQLPDSEIELSSIEKSLPLEYAFLWKLLEENTINPIQARSIVKCLANETLFDLVSLREGKFLFQTDIALNPQLISLEITPLVNSTVTQLQEWMQMRPFLESPEQFPFVNNLAQLQSSLLPATTNKLLRWAEGKTSLRQMARFFHRDILSVAKVIYPYVHQGLLKMVYPDNYTFDDKSDFASKEQIGKEVPILCIDSTATIFQQVESALKPYGYQVINVSNPWEALSMIFKFHPKLILCDMNMPELNGYEICALISKSTTFCQIPIILFTLDDNYLDKTKAKMLGAKDFLTKPFLESELIAVVEKYVNLSLINRTSKNLRLVDSMQDEIKNSITHTSLLQNSPI
jgi:twitching motility two-component system response regulator PilG